MSKWIRRGDRVVVIAGNDKDKTGTVMSRGKNKVIVQGVNMRKKHMKQRQEGQASQIVDMEMPVHISNISICSSDGKPVKVHVKKSENGEKELVYNENGKEVVYRSLKKHVG